MALNKLPTYIIWTSYNYLSPVDKVTCELDYLLKHEGVELFTRTTEKDADFLMSDAQLSLCSTEMKTIPKPFLTTQLIFTMAVVGSLILLLIVASIVLCVLKFKYKYQILQMDFLFRRTKGLDEEANANYYTANGMGGSVFRGPKE